MAAPFVPQAGDRVLTRRQTFADFSSRCLSWKRGTVEMVAAGPQARLLFVRLDCGERLVCCDDDLRRPALTGHTIPTHPEART